jgi:hypothetical protein
MRINGVWVGWGLGDDSLTDFTVRNFKAFARRMYSSYMGDLADTNLFDEQLYTELCLMQDKLVAGGHLVVGRFIRGVLDLPTETASGYRPPVPILPVVFTVEGHMSNMWVGPTATIGATLEAQGKRLWRPTGYDCLSLPFNNADGVNQLASRVDSKVFDDGKVFPIGTPWDIAGFSQGSMIVCEFMTKQVLPEDGPLHYRLADFHRGITFGNPDRAMNAIGPGPVSNPPKPNTSGVMLNEEFVTIGTPLEGKWRETAHTGDMFAENGTDAASLDKAAIARIVTENSWVGGPTAMFARVVAILEDIPAESYGVVMAIIEAIMFAVSDPNPHYTTVATQTDIDWIAGVAGVAV